MTGLHCVQREQEKQLAFINPLLYASNALTAHRFALFIHTMSKSHNKSIIYPHFVGKEKNLR